MNTNKLDLLSAVMCLFASGGPPLSLRRQGEEEEPAGEAAVKSPADAPPRVPEPLLPEPLNPASCDRMLSIVAQSAVFLSSPGASPT